MLRRLKTRKIKSEIQQNILRKYETNVEGDLIHLRVHKVDLHTIVIRYTLLRTYRSLCCGVWVFPQFQIIILQIIQTFIVINID